MKNKVWVWRVLNSGCGGETDGGREGYIRDLTDASPSTFHPSPFNL